MPTATYTLAAADFYEEPAPEAAGSPEVPVAPLTVPALKRQREQPDGRVTAIEERPAKRIRIGGTTAAVSGTIPFLPSPKEAKVTTDATPRNPPPGKNLSSSEFAKSKSLVPRTLRPTVGNLNPLVHKKKSPEPCIWDLLKKKGGSGTPRVKIRDLINTPTTQSTKFVKDGVYKGRQFTVVSLEARTES
ncbi:hypothetical protein BKA70DRAFT_574187 [Coprinopsis sp. MPI-PUGE-AT-0042]|nr:hypothetical protein BKA70DRAFT_574187 [Coprinopsis sp. MPI-PUGE-AT-0042]